MTPTFVVADDHPFVLMGVKAVFQKIYPDYEVLEAVDYASLLRVLDDSNRDFLLIVADLNMPDAEGFEGIKAVQKHSPEVPLMIISATESQQAINHVMAQGVIGYMFKSFDLDQMAGAIETVMAGDPFVPEGNVDTFSGDEFPSPVDQGFGAAALNKLPMGVVIVTASARVVFVNRNATDIIAQKDGITVDAQTVLRLDRADETRDLHGFEGGVLSVSRPSCLRSFSALVVPLNPDQQIREEGGAAVFLTDPEHHNEPPTAILTRLYGLTEAEARLLQALLIGKKLETVAEDNSVSLNTVRTHLKQVFRKTGTNRQPELISLVLNSSAYMASIPVKVEEDAFS